MPVYFVNVAFLFIFESTPMVKHWLNVSQISLEVSDLWKWTNLAAEILLY